MVPRLSAAYAAIFAIVFMLLSLRVAIGRWKDNSLVGEGSDRLARLIRAHANFAENVPFALILLASAEMLGTSTILVQMLGASLLVGRLLHAYGISSNPEPVWLRVAGYSLTLIVIGSTVLCILALLIIS